LVNYSGSELRYYEENTHKMGYVDPILSINDDSNMRVYDVTVSGDFYDFTSPYRIINTYVAGETYVFRQDDTSNVNQKLAFGENNNAEDLLYSVGVTTMGVAGRPGAYTQLEVSGNTPPLYFYNVTKEGMGGLLPIHTDPLLKMKLPMQNANDINSQGILDPVTDTRVSYSNVSLVTFADVSCARVNGLINTPIIDYDMMKNFCYQNKQ
jgi:hypothetical protein